MARLLSFALLFAAWLSASVCSAQIYWAQETVSGDPFALTAINRTSLNGSSTQPFISGLNHPTDLVIDSTGGSIYWTESIGDAIKRADLDGANIQTLVNVNDPESLVTSSASNKMYWAGETKLYGANLNGSSVQVLSDPSSPFGEVSAVGKGHATDWIYYVENDYFSQMGNQFWYGTVYRFAANDFSTKQEVFGLTGRTTAIAIDDVNSSFYWSDDNSNIWRADLLDGSNPTLMSAGQFSRDLFVDHASDRLWWTWEEGLVGQPPTGGISSTPLQGGAITGFSVPFRPVGIWVVVPEPSSALLLGCAALAASSRLLTKRRSSLA